MGFLKRLFREDDVKTLTPSGAVERVSQATSVPEVLAGWPSAPAGKCDLCNVVITSSDSHCIPVSVFQGVVRQGYDPYARGRANVALFEAFGKSAADAYKTWLGTAARSTSDWGLCRACAEDVATFIVGGAAVGGSRPASGDLTVGQALRVNFGDQLADRLIEHLGLAGAVAFAVTTLDEARARWAHRNEPGFLTDEEREEMNRQARESGTNTVETRAAFQVLYLAAKVSGDVAREAIKKADLPNDLYPDLSDRLRHLLD